MSGDEKLSVTESVLAIPAELFFRGQENFVFKIIRDRLLPMVQINTIAFFIRYCIVWAGFLLNLKKGRWKSSLSLTSFGGFVFKNIQKGNSYATSANCIQKEGQASLRQEIFRSG